MSTYSITGNRASQTVDGITYAIRVWGNYTTIDYTDYVKIAFQEYLTAGRSGTSATKYLSGNYDAYHDGSTYSNSTIWAISSGTRDIKLVDSSIIVKKTTATQDVHFSLTYYSTSARDFPIMESHGALNIPIPALPKYTVSFNANDHGTAPSPQSVFYGYKASKPDNPSATGYTFGGWYKEAACTNIWNFDNAITAPTTLYAKWAVNSYTLSYNANGGSVSPTSNTIIYGANYILPTPTRANYNFDGWYTAASGGTKVTTSNTMGAGNTTVFAHWAPKIYTITLNNQSATSAGTTAYYEKYAVNNYTTSACTTTITTITIPTRNGYRFNGYYTSTGGGGTQYINARGEISAKSNTFTGNTTLYAYWTSYAVTLRYNVGQGTVITGAETNRWRSSGGYLQRSTDSGATWNTVTHPVYTYDAVGSSNTDLWNVGTPPIIRTGYHIIGNSAWVTPDYIYLNQDYSSSNTTNPVTAYRLNGDAYLTSDRTIDITPNWIPNTYTINYDGNGSTSGTTDSSSHTYDTPKALTANGFKRPGYVFQGWATSSTGSKVYDNNQSVSNLVTTQNGSTTLYAVWAPRASFVDQNNSDYLVSIVATGQVNVRIKDGNKDKITYGDIPLTVVDPDDPSIIYQVVSIDNCFQDCNNLEGDIFVNFNPTYYNNVFDGTTKPIYILCTDRSIDHSIWSDIANSYSNVSYLGIDSDYSYEVIDRTNHKISAKVLNTTKIGYSNPKETINSTVEWTLTSLENAYDGCVNLRNSPTLPDSVENMESCFYNCVSLSSLTNLPNNTTKLNFCFYNCENLISVSNIPSNVNDMHNCFEGCKNLTGNIIVNSDIGNKNAATAQNIFTNTVLPIYIIGNNNIATNWRSIVTDYSNVHYEADDIDLTHATISVTRQLYSDSSLNNLSFSDFTGAYIKTDFKLFFNNIVNCPIGWKVSWNNTIPITMKMKNTYFDTSISMTETSSQLYFNNIYHLIQNNDSIKISVSYYITINDNDIQRNISKTVTYTVETSEENKNIINVDYKDSDYLYAIIANNNNTYEVAIYTIDKTKTSYINPTNPTIDNTLYTITSFHYPTYDKDGNLNTEDKFLGYCYENCINLVTIPILPSTVLDLTQCFKNCTSLKGNLLVNYNPSDYNDMFTGTTQHIYIVNQGSADAALWTTIANSYKQSGKINNIHYEGKDNGDPTIQLIHATRGIYNQTSNEWQASDSGEWIKLDIQNLLANNYLPAGWVNEYIKEITIVYRGRLLENHDFIIAPNNISYQHITSKTFNSTITYYGFFDEDDYRPIETTSLIEPGYVLSRDIVVQPNTTYYSKISSHVYEEVTPQSEANPQEEGWYELYTGNYYIKAYSRDFTIYFEDWDVTQGTAVLQIEDFYNKFSAQASQTIYQLFAMLDFIPGGQGMAIGKIGNKNGLEIGLPTMIGEELIPPLNEEEQVDLQNRQLIIGRFNAPASDAAFIIGNGTDNDHRSNSLEVYWDGTIVGLTPVSIIRWI